VSQARLIIGDVREVLRSLPDNSVDLVLTSPPFLALRSYLPADHPDKAKELGSEPTPGAFIDALLDVVEEVRRVLAPHGSLCVELGDTYAGSGGGGGDYLPGGLREDQPGFGGSAENQRNGNAAHWRLKNQQRNEWPQDKSLCGVPELFRLSLMYGRNLLTGRETEPWRIRNVIRWVRPNPPVGALGDKFRPATSEMVVACTSRTRYFDLNSVRGEPSDFTRYYNEHPVPISDKQVGARKTSMGGGVRASKANAGPKSMTHKLQGAPPLDWWAIPTEPYPGSHYATWPRDLLVKPVKAMCPERVCRTCGEPSRRLTGPSNVLDERRPQARRAMELAAKAGLSEAHLDAVRAVGMQNPKRVVTQKGGWKPETKRLADEAAKVLGGYYYEFAQGATAVTLGWTDCGHSDDWRNGVVLDPFAGSGTSLAVATGHGRDAIGIDLDAANVSLAEQRVGMFLTVEHFSAEEVA